MSHDRNSPAPAHFHGGQYSRSVPGQHILDRLPKSATCCFSGRCLPFVPEGLLPALKPLFAQVQSIHEQIKAYDKLILKIAMGSGGKWQISSDGGSEPIWRSDGKELFYAYRNKLMALEVNSAGESFEAGIPSSVI